MGGLLLLLLIPTLVVGALGGYAEWRNAQPQTGPLTTDIVPAVVFPWSETTYRITLNGRRFDSTSANPLVDMAFLIDVSGSMRRSLPAMADAARTIVQDLARRDARTRFSVIRFDSESEINTSWTSDPSAVAAGLDNLSAFTGENDSRAAFNDLKSLLRDARPGAQKIAVFYTDGALSICPPDVCPDGPMTNAEMEAEAATLRQQGVEIHSVGLPGESQRPLMRQITGTPAHVHETERLQDLTTRFRHIANSIGARIGSNGRLTNRLDGRYFSASSLGPNWSVSRDGTIERKIPVVPARDVTYAHGVEPDASGLWRVGINAPERIVPSLSFATLEGELRTLKTSYHPRLLVIGWFVLFLGLLPALFWTFLFLRQGGSPESVDDDLSPPAIPKQQRPTSRLPTLPEKPFSGDPPVPTLFIGLGGAGWESLHAVRNDLKQAHLDEAGLPYDFLHFDLEVEESSGNFDHWEAYPIRALRAPADIRRTDQYLPDRGETDPHLEWFSSKRYRSAPRETLNLSNGAREERALARLALFRWLGKEIREEYPPEECLLPVLEEHVETLLSQDSPDGTRQVVVFASADGGTGSGWVADVGRLLRRIARCKQRAGDVEFVPEMMAVLLSSDEDRRPLNRDALNLELESASLAGAFPQKEAYVPDADQQDHPDGDLLNQRDTEPPYNYILNVPARDGLSAAARSAEAGSVLVRRQPRTRLLEQLSDLRDHPVADLVQARGLHVHPTRLLEHVSHGLLMRLMGPDVLIDAVTDPESGGYQFRSISSDVARQELRDWGQSGPLLWRRLVQAASEPAQTTRWVQEVEKHRNGGVLRDPEWFARTLRTSVSTRLHGERVPGRSTWTRVWMPSEAVGTLRLFADRIENEIRPRVEEEEPLAILDRVQTVAENAAASLEAWGSACCERLTEETHRLKKTGHALETLNDVRQRTYVDPTPSTEAVNDLVEECLEQWLERPDTGSILREHLFPLLRLNKDAEDEEVEVVVRSLIDEPETLETPEAVVDALAEKSNALAHLTPSLHIRAGLRQNSEETREEWAEWLVKGSEAPNQVLVAAPSTDGPQAFEPSFVESIPQPANHGERHDRFSGDGSAVRRLGLSPHMVLAPDDLGELRLIESAEQNAEVLRARAENAYLREVPSFPPALRRALADPVPFRSFACAFQSGHLTKREDDSGVMQWYFEARDEFLTFGPDDSLADAAANYVWYVPNPPESFDGDAHDAFHRLEQWEKGEIDHPDEDVLTMIAIDVFDT